MSEPHERSIIAGLRSWYLGRLNKTAKWFLINLDEKGIPRPSTLQEIPTLAKEMLSFIGYPEPDDTYLTAKGILKTYEEANPAKEIIQMSLEIAKELKLLRSGMDLPLRRVWYAFIKAALERGLRNYIFSERSEKKAGMQREAMDSDYYDGFSDIIKNAPALWYDVYGVKNTGKLTFVPFQYEGGTDPTMGDMFSPIMMAVEKASYFDVLKNMCQMLGLSLYGAAGQSSVSASEEIMKRINPIMKEKKQEHLDIYAITDFDPAGYDIAKNIYRHSKLFIERYGGTVDYERLAPLPKHYTDIELEQGLYTVKKKWTEPSLYTFKRGKRKGETEEKGHWGYNPTNRVKPLITGVELEGIKTIRERDEAIVASPFEKDARGNYIQGLEIESLPEEPLEELLENPPSVMPSVFSGIARMRFIIFDDLIKRHGLEGAFKFLIGLKRYYGATYSGEDLVRNVVNVKNIEKIDEIVRKADSPFWKLHTDIELWIQEYIEDEKKEVADDIDAWLDDVIEQYTNPEHEDYDKDTTDKLKDDLRDEIYRALAQNRSSIRINFPEKFKIEKVKYYEEKDDEYYHYLDDFEITIPDEIADNIRPIANFAQCIALNAQQAVDYLDELKGELEDDEHIFDREWEIPPVRACRIENGEVVFSEIVEGNCEEYKEEIEVLEKDIRELRRLAELRKSQIEELEKEAPVPSEEIGKMRADLKELREAADIFEAIEEEFAEAGKEIVMYKVELEKCIEERDKIKKELDESEMVSEERYKELSEKIDVLTERIEKLTEEVPIKKPPVKKLKVSAVERYEMAKDQMRKLEEDQMKDAIRLLNGEITGTDYQMKWGLLPPSYDQMEFSIPLDIFMETELVREVGKDAWETLTDEEKQKLVNMKIAGSEEIGTKPITQILLDKRKEEYKDEMELKEHLHDIFGYELPLKDEEETYEDVVSAKPFKDWFNVPDISDPKFFKLRMKTYERASKEERTVPTIIAGIMREKIDKMEKMYTEHFPNIEKAKGEEKHELMRKLAHDLDRINKELFNLYLYGR